MLHVQVMVIYFAGASGKLTLKPFAESCSYLQYRVPLTEHHPCFYVRVDQLCKYGEILAVCHACYLSF